MAAPVDNLHWQKLVNSKDLSDVEFTVGSDSTLICGHRTPLALASDVFYRMFLGALVPSAGQPISVPDIEPEIFLEMLKFIYYDGPNITADNLVRLYYAAEKYNLVRFKERCLQFVANHEEAMLQILNDNGEYNFQRIDDSCLKIMSDNPVHFFEAPNFLELSLEQMQKIVNQRTLRCNTEQLKAVLEKWENHRNGDRQGSAQTLMAIVDKWNQQSRYFQLRKLSFFGRMAENQNASAKISIVAQGKLNIYGVGLYVGKLKTQELQESDKLSITVELKHKESNIRYAAEAQLRKDVYVFDFMFKRYTLEADSMISLDIHTCATTSNVLFYEEGMQWTEDLRVLALSMKLQGHYYVPAIAYILYDN
ncbi:kelch-like protein 30 [Armigeres subalbatus]|uniref:kelch-like protein 30 n=1 Tax=Armigeres subalbatus TaxID=124917 RepID=UPI002ED11A27